VARTWSPPLGDQIEDKVVNFGDAFTVINYRSVRKQFLCLSLSFLF
jgi:hypothetical protein